MLDPATLALPAMSLSAGEALEKVLALRGIEKTAFAEKLQRDHDIRCDYRKVFRWTSDEGFNLRNRHLCARSLGLPLDYFDKPDIDESARAREMQRRNVFAQFLATEKGQGLQRDRPEIIAALDKMPVPEGWSVLTPEYFEGIALVMTGHLTREQFDASYERNRILRTAAKSGAATRVSKALSPHRKRASTKDPSATKSHKK